MFAAGKVPDSGRFVEFGAKLVFTVIEIPNPAEFLVAGLGAEGPVLFTGDPKSCINGVDKLPLFLTTDGLAMIGMSPVERTVVEVIGLDSQVADVLTSIEEANAIVGLADFRVRGESGCLFFGGIESLVGDSRLAMISIGGLGCSKILLNSSSP